MHPVRVPASFGGQDMPIAIKHLAAGLGLALVACAEAPEDPVASTTAAGFSPQGSILLPHVSIDTGVAGISVSSTDDVFTWYLDGTVTKGHLTDLSGGGYGWIQSYGAATG